MNAQRFVHVTFVAIFALAGCGDGSGGGTGVAKAPVAKAKRPAAVSPSGYKRRTVESLPPVGDPMPPLDGGRVEIAGPEGWRPMQRNSSEYVVGFVKDAQLPRLIVTAGDPPATDLADTTEENAHLLAQKLDADLMRRKDAEVHEHCLPIVLGDRTFVRHVRMAKLEGGDPLVIQSLQTIAGSRLYSVELICAVDAADAREYVDSLKAFRDQGYAVAANMKFTDEASTLASDTEPVAKGDESTAP